MDRVQVMKQESAALGGDDADGETPFAPFPKPIEPQEDAIETAGIYLQDTSNRDETTLITRDGDDLTFKDGNNVTPVTLTDLQASGGLTAEQHKTLRQLTHFVETNSPGEGWGDGPYQSEVLPSADPFPTSETWYTTSGKTNKICKWECTYTANKTYATETWTVYKSDGSSAAAVAVDTISYSGVFEIGRSRVITLY